MKIQEFEKQLILNYSSKQTIKTYTKQVNFFLKFCGGIVNQDNLDKYLIQRRREISTSSYNLFVNAIRKYFEIANIEITLPKLKFIKSKQNPYLTEKELEKNILPYLTVMFNNYTEIEIILLMLFYTGLRPSEIVNFKVNNIDFSKKMFIVKSGKGEKDRIIPFLNNKLTTKLQHYILNRTDYLFNITHTKLTYICNKIQEECGFNVSLSPYVFRRSFAKYAIQIGIDISILQLLLGHNDIQTTLIYAQPDQKMVVDVCKKIREKSNK